MPVARWPDAVLEGRAGGYPTDIHAIYSIGGNYLNQGSQIAKSIAAFEKVDFAICHELFLTPTARYCDVVLPAAHALEKEDIGLSWCGNFITYKAQAVPPQGEARTDYDILCDLAERLGFGAQFSEGRSAAQWVQHFLDQSEVPDHDAFRRTGFYSAADQERTGLADFTRDPAAYPLSTPSGLVEIASARYAAETGFPAIPTWQPRPQDVRYPLQLITPKSPHRTHSQGSNIAEIRRKASHALDMHPADAAARGIGDGDQVRLFNADGRGAGAGPPVRGPGPRCRLSAGGGVGGIGRQRTGHGRRGQHAHEYPGHGPRHRRHHARRGRPGQPRVSQIRAIAPVPPSGRESVDPRSS